MAPVSGRMVMHEVRRLGTESPERVYAAGDGGCYNVTHEGVPPCIIGQAVQNLTGETDDTLKARALESLGVIGLLGVLGIQCTVRESRWLIAVQRHQDTEHTWGDAIQRTDREEQWWQMEIDEEMRSHAYRCG